MNLKLNERHCKNYSLLSDWNCIPLSFIIMELHPTNGGGGGGGVGGNTDPVSYTHLRAHETSLHLVCRLLLEKNFFFLRAGIATPLFFFIRDLHPTRGGGGGGGGGGNTDLTNKGCCGGLSNSWGARE